MWIDYKNKTKQCGCVNFNGIHMQDGSPLLPILGIASYVIGYGIVSTDIPLRHKASFTLSIQPTLGLPSLTRASLTSVIDTRLAIRY